MSHPFKAKQQVRCVKQTFVGHLEEGDLVHITRTFFGSSHPLGKCAKGMEDVPGVCLKGYPYEYFAASRFEAVA